MAFTIPWNQMEEIIEGLKGTHDGGIRYPITQFMEYEAKLPPKLHGGQPHLGRRARPRAVHQSRPRRRRVPAARSPIASRSTRSSPRSPARSTASRIEEYCTNVPKAITAMMNYYERYQPDVVLAYNDLAKEAEAFGCRVKYSDYVVPSIDAARAARRQGEAGAPGHARSVRRRRGCPASSSSARRWCRPSPPTAIGAVAVGPGRSPCCSATPRRCCSTPSRTRSSSTTSCGSRPTSARSGATRSRRPGSASPSPSRPPRSA